MARAGIEQLLYMMSEAFHGNDEHSLLANTRSLAADDWHWRPENGVRSAFDIVQHVGECKYVYENHAFGDASMRWDRPKTIPTVAEDDDPERVKVWLETGQKRLIDSVRAVEDDADLLKLRSANWEMSYQTRWLISVMIEHDLYHAGEINHIRALKQQNDRWAHETND